MSSFDKFPPQILKFPSILRQISSQLRVLMCIIQEYMHRYAHSYKIVSHILLFMICHNLKPLLCCISCPFFICCMSLDYTNPEMFFLQLWALKLSQSITLLLIASSTNNWNVRVIRRLMSGWKFLVSLYQNHLKLYLSFLRNWLITTKMIQ